MPLYMDFHLFSSKVSVDDVIKAHIADVAIQEKYGVKYHQFWVNEEAGSVFCLVEGPDKKTCELVHQMAHGNLACALTEVEEVTFRLMMGAEHHVEQGLVKNMDGKPDPGYRFIVVVSVQGFSGQECPSDEEIPGVPGWARRVVCDTIAGENGREIPWTHDECMIAVFNHAADALRCAVGLQHELKNSTYELGVTFKISVCVDQPVTKDGSFFTHAIRLARELVTVAEDRQILMSSLVRRLTEDPSIFGSMGCKFIEPADQEFITSLVSRVSRQISDRDFRIDELCRKMGMSRPQLYRKVTALTGRSPNIFLRDLRLERAFSMLRKRSGNVSQVALEMGYSNPSYFSKCFADKFGFNPSDITAVSHG